MKAPKFRRILYIATNIPNPRNPKNNGVILKLANHISLKYNVRIIFPRPLVPNFLKPWFKLVASITEWQANNLMIQALPFVYLPVLKYPLMLIGLDSRLKRQVRSDVDLVHGHYLVPDGVIARKIASQNSAPFFVSIRGHDLANWKTYNAYPWLAKEIKKSVLEASEVFVFNKAARDIIFKNFQVESVIISHGIRQELIMSEVDFRNKLARSKDHVQITTIGNLIPLKNIIWVLNAVSDYSGPTSIKLQVIGEGELLEEFKSFASDRIEILGRINNDQVHECLYSTDIFALPSFPETFGLVYLEAAAKGCAMIGHENSGPHGVFKEEGEMLFSKDYESFKEMLYSLIENNTKRLQLQKNAWKRVHDLTWTDIYGRYEKYYNEAIKNKNIE